MKTIDLSTSSPNLPEILQLASEENVILKTADGRQFVVAEIDDFAEEVRLTRQNEPLMRLLDERSKETATFSLKEVREQLQKKRASAKPKQPKKR
jgi:hypothetical protein